MQMKIKQSPSGRVFDGLNYFFMLVLAFITLYPFYYVAISSISAGTAVARAAVSVIPIKPTLASYKMMLQDSYFLSSMFNTVKYTIIGTFINLLMSVLCAYPLSISTFSGRKFFTAIIVFTMFFSGGLIPTYLVVKSLGLIDTIWAVVIPGAISTVNMIIIRTFFQGIPSSLKESAYIDGANDIYILIIIILPLSKPVLATMTLFYATGHWNNFFTALLYITDKAKYPLQLFLRNMLISDQMSEQYADISRELDVVPTTLKYAAIMISSLPIVMVYPFVQRYFVKGVMIGSLKG
jgi:putative aldouronate transport system permease protein